MSAPDYIVGVKGSGFSARYFAKARNGHIIAMAANGGTEPTEAKANDSGWNTQTSSGLKDVLDAIWEQGKHIHFASGTFDFGYQFYSYIRGITDMEISGEGRGGTKVRNFSVGTQDREPFSCLGTHRTHLHDICYAAGGDAKGAGTLVDSSDAVDFDNCCDCVIERIGVIASRDRGIVLDGKDNKSATSDAIGPTTLTDTGAFIVDAWIGHRVVVNEDGHDHTLWITGNTTNVLTGALGWFPHEPTADALTYTIVGEARGNKIIKPYIDGTLVDVTPTACTAALGGAGSIEAGTYTYAVAFLDEDWRISRLGTPSAGVVGDGSHNIDLTDIPTGPTGTRARVIYRNQNGGDFSTLVFIFDNTTTTFEDDVTQAVIDTPHSDYVGGGGVYDSTIWGDGIELLGACGNSIDDPEVQHCGQRGINIIKGSGASGTKAKRNTVRGGVVANNVQHNVAITSCDNCKIIGVDSLNAGQARQEGSPVASDGVLVTTADGVTSEENIVALNQCIDDQGTATQRYGVNIHDTDCIKTIVANNQLLGNDSGALNDAGTSTVDDDNVKV